MSTKNKLAKQLIQKFSLHTIPHPFRISAINAIMEFSVLAEKHERKAIRALTRHVNSEKRKLIDSVKDSNIENWAEDR